MSRSDERRSDEDARLREQFAFAIAILVGALIFSEWLLFLGR
jgi:hypothetical protein